MRRAVDLLKLADRHLRVDLRRLQIGVAEHRLNEADIGAAFEHQRRHGVPEHVARAALADVPRPRSAHQIGEMIERE